MAELAPRDNLAAHPLPMGLEEVGMGLMQLARDDVVASRFTEADPSGRTYLDVLATEDLWAIVDEDSGEALALG